MRSFLPQLFPPKKNNSFSKKTSFPMNVSKNQKKTTGSLGVDPLPLQSVQLRYPQKKTTWSHRPVVTILEGPFSKGTFIFQPIHFRCCIIVLGISVITLPPPTQPPKEKKNPCSIHSPICANQAKPSPLLSTLPTLQPPVGPAIPGQVGDLRWDLLLFAPGAVEGLLEPVKAVPKKIRSSFG